MQDDISREIGDWVQKEIAAWSSITVPIESWIEEEQKEGYRLGYELWEPRAAVPVSDRIQNMLPVNVVLMEGKEVEVP
jgi:hypothetical protein